MKFKFPLEKVMHHRKSLENIAKRNYLEALAILDEEKSILDRMYRDLDDARLQAHLHESRGGTTAESLKHIHEFSTGQNIRIERQRLKVRDQNSVVENLLEILKNSSQEYKIIEKLKEKKFQEFRKESDSREQKELDDMVTSRFKKLAELKGQR